MADRSAGNTGNDQRDRKPVRARVFALLTLAAAICVTLTGALLPRQRSLRERATRVAPARGWSGTGTQTHGIVPYFWLSDHEVLWFRGNDPLEAVRREIRTGRDTPFLLRTPAVIAPPKGFPLTLSPDRRWLLWVNERGARQTAVASRVDGSRAVTWPRPWYDYSLAWLPDNSGWVWHGTVATVHRLAGSRVDLVPFQTKFVASRPGRVAQAPHLLGTAPGGKTIAFDTQAMHNSDRFYSVLDVGRAGFVFEPIPKQVAFVELDLVRPGAPGRRFTLPMPSGAEQSVLALSPAGDRIAWLTYRNGRAPAFLNRLPQELWLSSWKQSASLWVAPTDGGKPPRLVGRLILDEGESVGPPSWTPDGRRLSYLYQDALWTLPVD